MTIQQQKPPQVTPTQVTPPQVKPAQVKPGQVDAAQTSAPQRKAEAHDDGPLESLGEAVGEVVTGANPDESTRLEGVTERPQGSTPAPKAKP